MSVECVYALCAVLWAGSDRDKTTCDGDSREAGAADGLPEEDPHPLDWLPQLLWPGLSPAHACAPHLTITVFPNKEL